MVRKVNIIHYLDGDIIDDEYVVDIFLDGNKVEFRGEIYNKVGRDGPDYLFQSFDKQIIRIGIDEVDI